MISTSPGLNHLLPGNVKPLMRKLSFLFVAVTFGMGQLKAQSVDKPVQEAFLVSKMVEKFHVQPRPLDAAFSDQLYTGLLDELDDQKIFFTQDDIKKLSVYRSTLNEMISSRNPAFLQLLTGILRQRLKQADSVMEQINRTVFPLTSKEALTAVEDSTWPADKAAMKTKLIHLIRLSVLNGMASRVIAQPTKNNPRSLDSLETAGRQKVVAKVRRSIQRMLQSPMGFENMIGAIFCQTLASTYDPHTDYFPKDLKDAFETQLGNKPIAFGLTLKEDDDGVVRIGKLIPGSPAFKSGGLNEGDQIITIQWDGGEPIDVAGAGLEEMNNILSSPIGGGKAIFTVKKTDGTTRQVILFKARLENSNDEEKVQGFVLKGARNIGYISLPAFYSDWEDTKGINGCANDVAREIIRMKKENIHGLILDLRYNGGGSVTEAVELAGLFIDYGPVEQITGRDNQVVTLKDVNRGTIYDGPLVLMVNGYSASASEIVAGTLQDYNRALIVGSTTYGKATAQVVLPVDTALNLENYDSHDSAYSYIKVTMSRLFRVNGKTAQVNGVKPDVNLPDPPNAVFSRESDEKNALQVTAIAPNKYYHPLAPLPVEAANTAAQKELGSSAYFKYASAQNGPKEGKTRITDRQLSFDAVLQAKRQETMTDSARTAAAKPGANTVYTVTNLAYRQLEFEADHELKDINKEYLNTLQKDPYLKVSYEILAGAMIKQTP